MIASLARGAAFLAAAVLAVAPAAAQKLRDKSKPRNDPVQCPYCKGEPELMEAAGIVSHGGFTFGKEDTKGVDIYCGSSDIKWIETAHFEIGFALGSIKVTQKEKDKIRGECARLKEFLPDVPEKPKTLDPWLRAHIYAMRVEDLWRVMVDEVLQVDESKFPDGTTPWDTTGEYMGEGPYLGQKGKYEILILPSEGASKSYLRHYFGLLMKLTQRWNVIDHDSLQLVIHTQQGSLKVDEALHGHVAFNVTHMLFNGYKHYSYDTPIWLHEGLAHWMERNINPKFNTFDSSEGAVAEMTRKDNWEPPTRKLVQKGEAPRLSQLMAMKGYAELQLEQHYTTWSMIDFLMKEHPDFIAKLLGKICGIVNPETFIADGSSLKDVHRDSFKEDLGMTYAQFDRVWAEWVLANYSVQ